MRGCTDRRRSRGYKHLQERTIGALSAPWRALPSMGLGGQSHRARWSALSTLEDAGAPVPAALALRTGFTPPRPAATRLPQRCRWAVAISGSHRACAAGHGRARHHRPPGRSRPPAGRAQPASPTGCIRSPPLSSDGPDHRARQTQDGDPLASCARPSAPTMCAPTSPLGDSTARRPRRHLVLLERTIGLDRFPPNVVEGNARHGALGAPMVRSRECLYIRT